MRPARPVLLLALLFGVEVRAQSLESRLNEVPAVRTTNPPIIDGRPDDPEWAGAGVISALTQVEPVEGAEPSERTEIRFLYDAENLYIAFFCYDSEASQIVSTQMVRDADLDPDDRIETIIDSFHDRRNAYFLQINPTGASGDALIENSSNFNKNWDGIWTGRSHRDAHGWYAEFAIPFLTLSFDPDNEVWGFNVVRYIKRKNEQNRWATPRRNSGIFAIADAGMITGLKDLEQGLGLDVRPGFALKYRHDHTSDSDVINPEPSLDVYYKFTPELTGALTVNTDFAETEVDERQVNLTRFPLFFPEKRDFFLQDAGIFTFGGLTRSPLPFFSRRIGINAGGEPVDIVAGLKLTGRVDRFNIGILDTVTAANGEVDARNLGVARVALNVFDQSSIGLIATSGDPRSNESNTVVGTDFNFRTREFLGDRRLVGNLWFLHSFTPNAIRGESAWGARVSYPNDDIEVLLAFQEIQSSFQPALGFVPRRGIQDWSAEFRYRWRTAGYFRRLDTGFDSRLVTNLHQTPQSADLSLNFIEGETRNHDFFRLGYQHTYERLESEFGIFDDVVVPGGEYNFGRVFGELGASEHRVLGASVVLSYGDFFSGSSFEFQPSLRFVPVPEFETRIEYEGVYADLKTGNFTTHLARLRFIINFSPDLSWNNFVQYDNDSHSLGINSRIRWIIEPGQEFFFVINQGFEADEQLRLRSTITEFTAKITWTFRF